MRGKLVGDVLEPMGVTCNIGSVQPLVREEQIRFICATGSGGLRVRSTSVYLGCSRYGVKDV